MTGEIQENCQLPPISYSGVKLPLNLVNPIAADALANRNTYIRPIMTAPGF